MTLSPPPGVQPLLFAPRRQAAWAAAARMAVRYILGAPEFDTFTADAVWHLLGKAKIAPPAERRALGAILLKHARNGDIVTCGYQRSSRRECHYRPVAVWRRLCPKGTFPSLQLVDIRIAYDNAVEELRTQAAEQRAAPTATTKFHPTEDSDE